MSRRAAVVSSAARVCMQWLRPTSQSSTPSLI